MFLLERIDPQTRIFNDESDPPRLTFHREEGRILYIEINHKEPEITNA